METLDGAELHLSNLYISAGSLEDPGEGSYLRQMRIRKSSIWMDTVTLEGSDDGLVEGVDVLGASSAPSLIYAHGAQCITVHIFQHDASRYSQIFNLSLSI